MINQLGGLDNKRTIVYFSIMRRRDDAKEEAIMQAAIRLINASGFADTSVSKIAKEAGVSPATIYIYFESKEDLLNKLYLSVKEQMVESIAFQHDPDLSWEENFKRIYDGMSRFLTENSDLLAFLDQCASNPMISEATIEEGAKMFASISAFIETSIANGIVKPLKQEVLYALIFAPLMNLTRSALHKNIKVDPDALTQLRDCCWDAVKA